MGPTSDELKQRIDMIRIKSKDTPSRKLDDDYLIPLERSILAYLSEKDHPVSVKELAKFFFGEEVEAEGRKTKSVRTIRNALRVPKAMDLIMSSGERGKYTVTSRFRKLGLEAARQVAAQWAEERRGKKDS